MKKRKKPTPEERAERERRRAEVTRMLEEQIAYLDARIAEQRAREAASEQQ